ncbi:MAG: stage V sporulation protein AE [Clostridia bacterium]|nr:stage V sporulation protein AE [Clostridia bacterium]
MDLFLTYLKVFITGGIICTIGQVIIDKTKLTPARILVLFVVLGVVLTGLDIYKPIVDFGGSGATVPISGFGYALANGVKEEIDKNGLLGIFTGGITATSAGITAAIVFGYLGALISKSNIKK